VNIFSPQPQTTSDLDASGGPCRPGLKAGPIAASRRDPLKRVECEMLDEWLSGFDASRFLQPNQVSTASGGRPPISRVALAGGPRVGLNVTVSIRP